MSRFHRALVTGASSGIGEQFARLLAERGVATVLVARSADRLGEIATDLRTAHGGSAGGDVEVLTADLLETGDLERVTDRLRDADAPVDLLVNNAGSGQVGLFADLDVDAAETVVRLNTIVPMRLTHAALPGLTARGGAILNVTSVASFQPVPRMATYAATKALLSSWSQALYEELRGTGVTVTALAPGFTRSGFVEAADAEEVAAKIPGFVWDSPEDVARAGLDGVEKGRAMVVPSLLYRVGVTASSMTPSAITRRVVGEVTRRVR
jgi:short-subunit dehydrogenase